jgi:hypothetical protein
MADSGWLRRWRGPWSDHRAWDEERRSLIPRLQRAAQDRPDDAKVSLSVTARECELIEWSLREIPRLSALEKSQDKVRDRFADAADLLVNEKGSWRFRRALELLGLIPEKAGYKYPKDMIRCFHALVTSSEPVTLSTPFGLYFKDPEATVTFEFCPMEPAEAVSTLRGLYGGKPDSTLPTSEQKSKADAACVKALWIQLGELKKELGVAHPDVVKLSQLLPHKSEY